MLREDKTKVKENREEENICDVQYMMNGEGRGKSRGQIQRKEGENATSRRRLRRATEMQRLD